MTKNPFLNALIALAYIVLVSLVMYWGSELRIGQDSLIAPVALVSLFTLSAAVMGYVFLSQPAQLYFADKKAAAIKLFLQTVGAFGLITVFLFGLLFAKACLS